MTAVAEAANHKRMEAAVAEAVAETKKKLAGNQKTNAVADAVADKTRSRGKTGHGGTTYLPGGPRRRCAQRKRQQKKKNLIRIM